MTDPLSPLVSLLCPSKTVSRSVSFRTPQNLRLLSPIHKGRRSCKPDLGYALSRFFEHTTQVLLALAMIMSLAGAHAQSLPKGGQYIAGSGSIASSGSAMTITQSSARGIINWQGFSIGSANAVRFNNGSGATLNQVLGGNLSAIEGELTATGSVYLINPNGIVVGPGGKVITGGSFIGSTLTVSNQQFMEGGALNFSGSLTSLNGAVINNGKIVSQNGNVTLTADSVTNAGSIFAPQGTVALAAGSQVLLKPLDGPTGIYVVAGKSGNATNSGRIAAAAAALESAGGNVYELAGNRSGLIDATGTQIINGQVWLTAPGGAVSITGKVKAKNANGAGGAIVAKGKSVTLEAGSVLDAAGLTGGGQIETSGEFVSLGNATVAAGRGGTWTIDPTDLTIDSTAASTIDGSLNSGTNVTEETTAPGASGSGTQSSGAGNINVDAALSWSSSAGLTLSAFNSINVNAPVTVSGSGSLTLTANNNVGGSSSGGSLNFASSIQFTGTGGALTINGNAYTLIQNMTELQSVSITGYYALAKNLDATGVTGFTPIGESTAFTGTFNGLGNTISNLTINTSVTNTGMFGQIGSGGVVEHIGLVGGSVTNGASNSYVGGLAGVNDGTITNAYATGTVTGVNGNYVGGLVGFNQSTITDAYATGAARGGNDSVVGGLAGYNNGGTISDSYATGALTAGIDSYVGGLAGFSSGTITNAYATGAATGGTDNYVGGLVGFNDGTVTDAYATGAVSGGSEIGGLVGFNLHPITDSYWDTATTGTTSGVGFGSASGTTGLTTQNWLTHGPIATGAWNTSTWVAGYPYPVLKALPYVLVTGSGTQTYGSSTPSVSISSSTDQNGNDATSLVTTSGLTWIDLASSTSNAGSSFVLGGKGATVSSGYQLTYNGTLTVNPAALTITANNASKTYGSAASLSGFTTSGLVNGNTVSGVTLASSGATATANAGNYSITANGAAGSGLSNYTITYDNGVLTVNPAALTITANNASKTYGSAASLSGFTTSGLVNGDTVSGVTLASSGAAATANAGNYSIAAAGSSLSNYTITYHDGVLTVNPATLTAGLTGTVGKTYDGNTTATLAPANYTLSGILNSDQVTLNDPASGVYDSAAVGSGIPVTVSGLSLLGAAAGNYTLANTTIIGDVGAITQSAPAQAPLLPFITDLPAPASGAGSLVEVGAANAFGPIPLILLPSSTLGTSVMSDGIAFSTGQSLTVDPEQTLNETGGVRHLKVNLPPATGSDKGGQQ